MYHHTIVGGLILVILGLMYVYIQQTNYKEDHLEPVKEDFLTPMQIGLVIFGCILLFIILVIIGITKFKPKQNNLEPDFEPVFPNQADYDSNTMLVYCHPRPLSDIIPHFMQSIFDTIGEEYNITTFLTIDNSEFNNTADLQVDGFSDEFINANKEKFKVVFLPDCGGIWYEYQRDNDLTSFVNLIEKLKNLVTPGGAIYFSKFIQPSMMGDLSNKLQNVTAQYDAGFTILKYTKPALPYSNT